jgi:Arc/MetJ family transcription regulator
MTKTLIDVDDATLHQAQHELGTATKRDTVNEALAQVVALAARRRDIERLRADSLPDLRDADTMSQAWQR